MIAYPASDEALERTTVRQFSGKAMPPTGFGGLDFLSTSCRPDVLRAPEQATPGDARAFERGYADHPRYIGPESAAYRAGYNLAAKREQIAADAEGESLWQLQGGIPE